MKRKSNRLGLVNYESLNIYYLTLNCFNRQTHFRDDNVVAACLEQLTKLKEKLEMGKSYPFKITLFDPKEQKMALSFVEKTK